jgi:Ca2+-binding EF-hand superfamily protein
MTAKQELLKRVKAMSEEEAMETLDFLDMMDADAPEELAENLLASLLEAGRAMERGELEFEDIAAFLGEAMEEDEDDDESEEDFLAMVTEANRLSALPDAGESVVIDLRQAKGKRKR